MKTGFLWNTERIEGFGEGGGIEIDQAGDV
jgi:hypothetical protein